MMLFLEPGLLPGIQEVLSIRLQTNGDELKEYMLNTHEFSIPCFDADTKIKFTWLKHCLEMYSNSPFSTNQPETLCF